MPAITKVECYRTMDGKLFESGEEAAKHNVRHHISVTIPCLKSSIGDIIDHAVEIHTILQPLVDILNNHPVAAPNTTLDWDDPEGVGKYRG